MSPGIGVTIADGTASVLIDNPAQRNAVTRAMCLELQDLMPRLDADHAVQVITLRGAGDTFCAGASLGEISSVLLDTEGDETGIDQLSRADLAITSVGKPTIALVDGACMGGGWQIASACDFIIASERSVFAITPAKLGIIYPRPGIDRLVRQVGDARAKYILFSAETFSARRAQELGLVAEVVGDDRFESRRAEFVELVRGRSQFSIHTIKQLVDAPTDAAWADAWSAMSSGPDMAIGIHAFLSRERPKFTWSPR
jgi:enoyl-CoA hydratase/carnithine racemase